MLRRRGRVRGQAIELQAVHHATREQLADGLELVRAAPPREGALELIVARPDTELREVLTEATLDERDGLVGDMWSRRPSSSTADGGPNPDAQVTVMSARAVALAAGGREPLDWAQAGDQLYVDLDLSEANLPAGARIEIDEAVLEVSAHPHLGCGKFVRRFGAEALKLFNSELGRTLRLRGLNAKVVRGGRIARGDAVRKLAGAHGPGTWP